MAKKSARARLNDAREAVLLAVDKSCIARGEAQWTNGYRTGATGSTRLSLAEEERLWQKERQQYAYCETTEKALRLALSAYVRIVKESSR